MPDERRRRWRIASGSGRRGRIQAGYDCDECGGTGWAEIPQPPGALTDTPEAAWVRRCRGCDGSGLTPGRPMVVGGTT
jgi:hypothetical protein